MSRPSRFLDRLLGSRADGAPVYLTDITRIRDYMRIKSEFLEGPQPASTAIEVKALARPELMIEVEAIAVV